MDYRAVKRFFILEQGGNPVSDSSNMIFLKEFR
jgi:hypothetical protein